MTTIASLLFPRQSRKIVAMEGDNKRVIGLCGWRKLQKKIFFFFKSVVCFAKPMHIKKVVFFISIFGDTESVIGKQIRVIGL